MPRLRHGILSVLSLAAFALAFAAEKPEPGQIRKVRTLEQPGKHVASLSFSADGTRLVTSGGKSVHVWDPATGKEVARFGYNGEYMGRVTLSPDGRIVAVCFGTKWEILLFDVASGQVQHRLRHDHYICGLAFAPDGKTLASAGGCDRTARLWEVATGKQLRWMRLRDPATGEEIDPTQPYPANRFQDCDGVAFSPDGKILAVGISDGSVRLCDPATGAETRRLFHKDDNNAEVYHLAFSPDGRFLATGGFHFKVGARLWDVATGKAVREFRLPPRPVNLSREQVELLTEILQPKALERALQGSTLARTQALAFSPDGKTLATSADRTCLWEVATGRVRHQLAASTYTLAFSPAGLLAIPGAEYALVNLWDWRDPCLERPRRLGTQEIDRIWADLAGEDAAASYRAIATLAAVPAQATEMLAQRLQSVEPATSAQIDQFIAELDDGSFAAREKAQVRLAALGGAARPALQEALAKHSSAEVRDRVRRLLEQLEAPPSPGQLRHLRAVEALECIGTAEARRVLQKLADGAAGAVETEDARAALKRLARK